MQTQLVIAGKVAGSIWLIYIAFTTLVLAIIGLPHGPYLAAALFGFISAVSLSGTYMLWRRRNIHGLAITALVISSGWFIYAT